MASLAESAARLVALLNEIDAAEKERHWKAGAEPQISNLGPQGQIVSFVSEGEIKEEVDRNLQEVRAIQRRQDSMRAELGDLAKLLAAPAHDRGVDWVPVLHFFNTWRLDSGDLVSAKTQAMMLQAILPVESPDAEEEKPVPPYEQSAYLSFVVAIRENPHLADCSLREVYDWIKQHGIELSGQPYHPPAYETWERYRRAGERKARSGNS